VGEEPYDVLAPSCVASLGWTYRLVCLTGTRRPYDASALFNWGNLPNVNCLPLIQFFVLLRWLRQESPAQGTLNQPASLDVILKHDNEEKYLIMTTVGIAQTVRKWATALTAGVRFPVRANCFFSKESRPLLGPTQPPNEWVRGTLSQNKAAGAWSWSITFTQCWGQEWWSYISNPPCLHDIVLNYFGTWRTLSNYEHCCLLVCDVV
jgi:hypothetical protein